MTSGPYRILLSRCAAALALLYLVCLVGAEAAAAMPNVERVSFTERADGMGYVIRFHVDAQVAAYSEPREIGGGRIEMILFNTGIDAAYQADAAEGPVVSYLEEVASGHLIFRFKIDPAQPVDAEAYRDRESDDLLLGLTYAEERHASKLDVPTQLPIPVRTASTSGSARMPDAPPAAERASESVPNVAAGDDASRSAAAVEGRRWMLDTIVIDAGHGGKDPGALANGVLEKDITLGVALKLGAYLEERLGVNVEFTRRDDRFIELKDRGRIANEQGGKLFISLHVNAAGAEAARGAETYFLGIHKTDAARTTMERENSVVKYESSPHEYESMTEEALIRMELTQSAYMRKSEQLSELIQEQFEKRVSRRNRGVKQAGFYVLWGASMPAVLVELGFLTNRSEAAFLSSSQGQDYMASAIYRAVRAYKEQYEKGLGQAPAD